MNDNLLGIKKLEKGYGVIEVMFTIFDLPDVLLQILQKSVIYTVLFRIYEVILS